jgi:NitT/TauT family transport system substrate-binding protein
MFVRQAATGHFPRIACKGTREVDMAVFSITRRRALAGLGLAAAAAAGPLPALAAEKINLGALRLTSHAPTYIAFERGYFTEAGIEIELKFFEAAQPMSVAIASGDVDFGVTAITGGLISLAEKGAIKVIGGALAEAPGIQGAVILASNEAYAAGLTEPSKLAGRSFGITTAGSSFHYMLSRIAAASHIPMDGITMKPLQKVGAIIGALSSGQIDAWVIQPSIADPLIAKGAARKIGDFNAYDPDYQVTTVFTSTRNATDRRAETAAFLKALARGVADYNAAFVDRTASAADTAMLAALVHKYVDRDVPEADFARTLATTSMRINQGLALSVASVTDQLQWFKDEGLVKGDVTEAMLLDTSYVETK